MDGVDEADERSHALITHERTGEAAAAHAVLSTQAVIRFRAPFKHIAVQPPDGLWGGKSLEADKTRMQITPGLAMRALERP